MRRIRRRALHDKRRLLAAAATQQNKKRLESFCNCFSCFNTNSKPKIVVYNLARLEFFCSYERADQNSFFLLKINLRIANSRTTTEARVKNIRLIAFLN